MSKWLSGLCAVAALGVAGCDKKPAVVNAMLAAATPQQTHNGKKIDVAEWQEEVRLFDGRTVIVWRKARAYVGGFPNAPRGGDIDFEFKYEPMGIHWKGEWNRVPTSFEIIDGVAYLVLYVGDRESCQGKPPTQYLAQVIKWANGQWVEVPLSEFSADKALLNLSTDYWGHTAKEDAKGLVPWEGKRTGGNTNDTVRTFFERGRRFCDSYQKI